MIPKGRGTRHRAHPMAGAARIRSLFLRLAEGHALAERQPRALSTPTTSGSSSTSSMRSPAHVQDAEEAPSARPPSSVAPRSASAAHRDRQHQPAALELRGGLKRLEPLGAQPATRSGASEIFELASKAVQRALELAHASTSVRRRSSARAVP